MKFSSIWQSHIYNHFSYLKKSKIFIFCSKEHLTTWKLYFVLQVLRNTRATLCLQSVQGEKQWLLRYPVLPQQQLLNSPLLGSSLSPEPPLCHCRTSKRLVLWWKHRDSLIPLCSVRSTWGYPTSCQQVLQNCLSAFQSNFLKLWHPDHQAKKQWNHWESFQRRHTKFVTVCKLIRSTIENRLDTYFNINA